MNDPWRNVLLVLLCFNGKNGKWYLSVYVINLFIFGFRAFTI